jgi:hypothetical protein
LDRYSKTPARRGKALLVIDPLVGFPASDLATTLRDLRVEAATHEKLGKATVHPCSMPAPLWGSPFDG